MKHPNIEIQNLLDLLANSQLAIIDLSLNRIRALLAVLGNPQNRLPPVIHIAGTNGKGSLASYLTAIFQAANYTVHRFTSPFLVQINEEIILANQEITDAKLLDLLQRVYLNTKEYPVTYFEALTAAAFLAFAETPADIVILETGLGGRLDATNMVIRPAVTAITPISLDHTEYLGDTIEKIAFEKAGILKAGTPCVVGPQVAEAMQIIEKQSLLIADKPPRQPGGCHPSGGGEFLSCHANELVEQPRTRENEHLVSSLFRFNQEWKTKPLLDGFEYISDRRQAIFPRPSLAGSHQINNAATAIAVIDCLENFKISGDAIQTGITQAIWPARLQRLSTGKLSELIPAGSELYLDGGHNLGAGLVLAQWAQIQTKSIYVICGMLKNKDTKNFLKPLAPYLRQLQAVAIPDEALSQDPAIIIEVAKQLKIISVIASSVKEAICSVFQTEQKDCIILICGSLYLAGYVLKENKL